jgi:hypothetical protein
LSSKSLDQWPTYAATIKNISTEEGEQVYQGQTLKKFSEAKTLFEQNYTEYCSKVTTRIRTRLSWSDMQLIHDIIFMLSTHGWQKVLDEKDEGLMSP